MSRRSSGEGEAMGWLIIVVFGGALIALWWLHRLIAWGVLLTARDGMVHLWGHTQAEEAEQIAVVFWRLVVPVLLFFTAFAIVFSELSRPGRYMGGILGMVLSLSAAGLLVYHYLDLYRQKTPKHRAWARFVAAEVRLRSSLKLAWIEEQLRWRLRR